MANTRKYIILSAFLTLITPTIYRGFVANAESEIIKSPAQKIDLNPYSIKSPSYRKRMRYRKTRERRLPTFRDATYEELEDAKDRFLALGSISPAIKFLEKMMKLCTNTTKNIEHYLELADLQFIDGDFKKAAYLYTQFATLYPGNEKMEYALYRAICSSHHLILSSDRDQTKTEETIGLTEIFLTHEHFFTYKDEVKLIQLQCYQQLAISECNICYYYLTRERFNAAEKRLKKIRTIWLPKVPTLAIEIDLLEAELIAKKEAAELLQFKNTQLAHNQSENKKNKRSRARMTERF